MESTRFLHLYLKECPSEDEIRTILDFYGFRLLKADRDTETKDPKGYHWEWEHRPLSGNGFKLVFYHGVFPDDKYCETYNSFVMVLGSPNSSDIDIAFMDIITKFLLDRYEGIIHNPTSTLLSSYLNGQQR